MNRCIREGIEYIGICEYIPNEILFFNDIFVEKKVSIKNDKVKIGKFLRCGAKAYIENFSPRRRSKESELYQLRVKGYIDIRSEYLGGTNNELIYSDRKRIKFSMEIDIIENLVNRESIKPSVYIEDIFIKKLEDSNYIISLVVLGAIEGW